MQIVPNLQSSHRLTSGVCPSYPTPGSGPFLSSSKMPGSFVSLFSLTSLEHSNKDLFFARFCTLGLYLVQAKQHSSRALASASASALDAPHSAPGTLLSVHLLYEHRALLIPVPPAKKMRTEPDSCALWWRLVNSNQILHTDCYSQICSPSKSVSKEKHNSYVNTCPQETSWKKKKRNIMEPLEL